FASRRPVGVAGLISPWNLPLYLLTWKVAPAIAFGNTCVAKPSELTSLTASMFAEILREAGLPKGVVNLVFGFGSKAGAALVAHDDVPLISFTG
ncbi:MAG: aldehyde dehydrogenase family protein, partial [Bdellovibrionota bacterium]